MPKPFSPQWHDPVVSDHLASGSLWRAKEHLQGRMGSDRFSPHVCADYGKLLLIMGDTLEAGKYLFLSGERQPEYEEAIQLYLQRYGQREWQYLVASFPGRARNLTQESFPPAVQTHLKEMQYPPDRGTPALIWTEPTEKKRRTHFAGCARDTITLFGCALVVLFFGGCFLAGFFWLLGMPFR